MDAAEAAGTGTRPSPARPPGDVLAWSWQQVEPVLRQGITRMRPSIQRIAAYHFGWCEADGSPAGQQATGGKAIRSALVLLTAEVVGGGGAAAVPAAVAVELAHNFSLIQDDLIDGDQTRRHRPAVWSVYGGGAAIVTGDALLALALDMLAGCDHPAATAAMRMLGVAVQEMVEGELADLSFEDQADVDLLECVEMAAGKTGALLACACAVGGSFGSGSPTQVALLRGFGAKLGVAFQLADDLLGIWGDPARTGKPVYGDLRRRKKSMPVVAALTSSTAAGAELARLYHHDRPLSEPELAHAALLVERAGGREWTRARAGELLAEALDALRSATATSAGAVRASRELTAVAELVVHRDR